MGREDEELFEGVLQPPERAHSLPPGCYTSPDWLEREIACAFRPAWASLGRADRLAAPGDYAALDLAGVPLLLLRDKTQGKSPLTIAFEGSQSFDPFVFLLQKRLPTSRGVAGPGCGLDSGKEPLSGQNLQSQARCSGPKPHVGAEPNPSRRTVHSGGEAGQPSEAGDRGKSDSIDPP